MATQATTRLTFEDYFAWEYNQEFRHEFINGQVYAMTGGSLRHSRVIAALIASLFPKLRGGRCTLFQGDAKLFVAAIDMSFYPDAFVCCDAGSMQERGVVTDATAIFEVLSPSTSSFNRGLKFEYYRKLPGLRHYVMLDPEALKIEAFERIGDVWTLVEMADRDDLVLPAIDVTLSKRDLFDGLGDPNPSIGHPITTSLGSA